MAGLRSPIPPKSCSPPGYGVGEDRPDAVEHCLRGKSQSRSLLVLLQSNPPSRRMRLGPGKTHQTATRISLPSSSHYPEPIPPSTPHMLRMEPQPGPNMPISRLQVPANLPILCPRPSSNRERAQGYALQEAPSHPHHTRWWQYPAQGNNAPALSSLLKNEAHKPQPAQHLDRRTGW